MSKPNDYIAVFCYFNQSINTRIDMQQMYLLKSCIRFNIKPILLIDQKKKVYIGDLLQYGRDHCTGTRFLYINSDCVLVKNPYLLPEKTEKEINYGFRRIEVPTGELCAGIDAYLISCKFWDEILSKDIPKMLLGASHTDWWLTRAMQKYNAYIEIDNYLIHQVHEKVIAPEMSENVKQYNLWADRNGVEKDLTYFS